MIMSKLQKIKQIKEDLRIALEKKGISVSNVNLYRYEERIRQLPIGGEPQNTWYITDDAGKITNIILVLPDNINFFDVYTGANYPLYEIYYNNIFNPQPNIDYTKNVSLLSIPNSTLTLPSLFMTLSPCRVIAKSLTTLNIGNFNSFTNITIEDEDFKNLRYINAQNVQSSGQATIMGNATLNTETPFPSLERIDGSAKVLNNYTGVLRLPNLLYLNGSIGYNSSEFYSNLSVMPEDFMRTNANLTFCRLGIVETAFSSYAFNACKENVVIEISSQSSQVAKDSLNALGVTYYEY